MSKYVSGLVESVHLCVSYALTHYGKVLVITYVNLGTILRICDLIFSRG
jgi:hypothetical protein